MDKIVYILRAVSGSGKTTLSKQLASAWCCFESDAYLYNDAGVYEWSPERVREAHRKCFARFCDYVAGGVGPLVVSNTNTSEREFQKYIDKAKDAGYTVFSIVLENRHGGKDVHGVPEETLLAQEQRIRSSLKLRGDKK